MSSALRGLSAHRNAQKGAGSKFLRLKDGDKVTLRFLQELDLDAKNYSTKNDVAVFTKEWQNPSNFQQVILDTMEEEGACVGKEMSNAEGGWEAGWRPKNRIYINALVDNGTDEPYVAILQFNDSPKAVQANALIDQHNTNGSITDREWVYSRTGAGQFDTVYKLVPKDKNPKLPPVEDYELLDIEAVLPRVPYAQQRAALGLTDETASPREFASSGQPGSTNGAVPAAAATPSTVDW
jgi:hypothetical protein